jgi:hypothetical protein
VASSKRRKNKKLYARRRKRQTASQTSREKSTPGPDPTPLPPRVRVRRPPSELDQIAVFIAEPELGRRETTLAELRQLAAALPFEAAMLNVALLNGRVEAVLNKAEGHWKLAQEFYGGDNELLRAYADVLARAPDRLVFSPQPLTLLMRVLIDDARDEPMRDLTSTEFATLQRAVLGAHSALESSLDATTWPNRDHVLAYELQAATFFHRPPYLEEMARHDELLRLAADDPRLLGAADRVPVREWLATYGLSANEQWVVGFALSSMTRAFADDTRPNALAAHVDDLLAKMKLPDVPRDLPVLAADRTAFQTAFAELGGGPDTVAWELRPFKRWPFLRMSDGDLLLLGRPWLLSWLGEGFHYRAMTHAQKLTPPQTTKYTAYVGQVVERYASDLAEGTFSEPHHVYGEQPYRSKDGDARTSDVALVIGEDLVLFEVHSRRVAATAAVTGDAVAATTEVSRLLVGKVDSSAFASKRCSTATPRCHRSTSRTFATSGRSWCPWVTSCRRRLCGTSCAGRWTKRRRVLCGTPVSRRSRSSPSRTTRSCSVSFARVMTSSRCSRSAVAARSGSAISPPGYAVTRRRRLISPVTPCLRHSGSACPRGRFRPST